MIDASFIKTAICAYYRFKKQATMVTTEVGNFSADVLAVVKDKSIEIEVKVSKTDFNNDFKKPKHKIYEDKANKESYRTASSKKRDEPHVPNLFYFAVPRELEDHVVEKLKDSKYGVLTVEKPNIINETNWPRFVSVVKKAKPLHNDSVDDYFLNTIAKRLTSELINYQIKEQRNIKTVRKVEDVSTSMWRE